MSQAHFNTQIGSNQLFEGAQVCVRRILVSIVIGVEDSWTESADRAGCFVHGHREGHIHANKGHIDPQEVGFAMVPTPAVLYVGMGGPNNYVAAYDTTTAEFAANRVVKLSDRRDSGGDPGSHAKISARALSSTQ